MTSIPQRDGSHYNSACSAALVAPRWVITAGHCFHDVNRKPVGGPVPYPTTATVGAGNVNAPGTRTIAITTVMQAPSGDVSLAELAAPVTGVTPVTVANRPPKAGRVLTFAGWPADNSEGPVPSSQLSYGRVKVRRVDPVHVVVHRYTPSPHASSCSNEPGVSYFREHGHGKAELVAIGSGGQNCLHGDDQITSRVDTLRTWITDTTHRPDRQLLGDQSTSYTITSSTYNITPWGRVRVGGGLHR